MDYNLKRMEALQTANEYSERLIEGVNDAVNYFKGGDENKAVEMMVDIIDGIQWIVQVMCLSFKNEDIEKINEHLTEMTTALENLDYILVSDILDYEIIPILKNWKVKIANEVGV